MKIVKFEGKIRDLNTEIWLWLIVVYIIYNGIYNWFVCQLHEHLIDWFDLV